MTLNKVLLLGNLTGDPVLLGYPNPSCTFTIAVDRLPHPGRQAARQRPDFIPITLYGRTASVCGAYLTKGSRVLLEGRIREDRWKPPHCPGRSRIVVVADWVELLALPRATPNDARPSLTRPGSTSDCPHGNSPSTILRIDDAK